jgi:hypothetical protein
MEEGLQLSARFVASILARIYGPSIYDTPRFGGGGPLRYQILDAIAGPHPEPWREVALNPQPLPPRAVYTVVLADAYIQQIAQLDRAAVLFGEDVSQRALDRAFRLVADVDEICPRWPRWPKTWPPPPPPPWSRETMTETELFVFGSRILAAAEVMEHGGLRDGLTGLGERVLGMSANAG